MSTPGSSPPCSVRPLEWDNEPMRGNRELTAPVAGMPAGDGPSTGTSPVIERRSFGRDVAHTTGTNLLIAAAGVVTGILVARTLQPAGRGQLAAILTLPTVLGLLTTLGIAEALVYFSAREPHRAGRYLASGVAATLPASVVFMVVGWFLTPVLLAAQSDEVIAATRWYLVQIPVAAVMGLVDRPLRGVGDVRWWNRLRLLPTAVWLVVVVGAALGVGEPTPRGMGMAFVLGRAALIPVALLVVRWRLRQHLHPEVGLVPPLVRFGLPSALATLPNTLNVRLDQLLIATALRPGELGLYAVAVAWSLIPSPIVLAFGSVLFPRVAGTRDRQARTELATRGTRVGVLAAVVLSGITCLSAPVGVPLLFGTTYRHAVPTAMVLSVASAAIGAARVEEEALRGLGRPFSVLWAQLLGLAVTAGGLAVTIPDGSLAFIAAASVAGYTTLVIGLTALLVRATGAPVHRVLLPRRGDLRVVVDSARRLLPIRRP